MVVSVAMPMVMGVVVPVSVVVLMMAVPVIMGVIVTVVLVLVTVVFVARIAPEEEGEAEGGDDQARHRPEPGLQPLGHDIS